MSYPLLCFEESTCEETPIYLEGVVFASNLATKPTAIESWVSALFPQIASGTKKKIEAHIHFQYNILKRSEYSLLSLIEGETCNEQLADFAEGFMTLWPQIEQQWANESVNDGTVRMLQAFLTTMMLAIDEDKTRQHMRAEGIESPPFLKDLIEQLDLMIIEIALAADELMSGNKSVSVNPFKDVGRNDSCPCGSGKKFKQCCGA